MPTQTTPDKLREASLSPIATPKLALIGCGAIADIFHLPALARHADVMSRLHLVDRDLERAQSVRDQFGAGDARADYAGLLDGPDRIDAAIIAVPRHLHYSVALDFVRAGIHVLCEKPLCQTPQEARELCDEAARAGAVVAVNQTQRAAWSHSKVQQLIASGAIGTPKRIELSLGEPFDWPATSNSYFGAAGSTRGALLDQGVHLLDLLCWWLGERPRLVDYRDDSFGGTEAVAHLQLASGACSASVTISWLSKLANTYRVVGDQGSIEGEIFDWASTLQRSASGKAQTHKSPNGPMGFADLGNIVIDNFLGVLRRGESPLVTGEQAMPALEIIDECYQRRARFDMPWNGFSDLSASEAAAVGGKTILVTGAGGFVGGRIVEVLHGVGCSVRAGVRRWSSAARIGRFPVDLVQCDVTDVDQVAAAMRGVDAVVHCAVGDRDVTVTGTQNVLDAAKKAGVSRVVHISTVSVYNDTTGEIHEDHRAEPSGDAYGDTKIEAEQACREYADNGLPVTILRPTLIYGPFSESWTIEWAQRLQANPWLLSESDCAGTCNLVYIDDLVRAIIASLDRDEAIGETFNINGPDRPSWQEYFEALNAACGLAPIVPVSASSAHLSAALMSPVRAFAKWLLANAEDFVMGLYQRYALAKKAMKFAEGLIKKTPTTGEFALLGQTASYPTDAAAAKLGYAPQTSMSEGTALSAQWLAHNGFVPKLPDR